MTDLHKVVQTVKDLMLKKKTGTVSFKGDIIVGDDKVPLETKVHLFEGGISNINFKGSIWRKKLDKQK